MSLSPIWKSPFTDFTGAIVSHQWGGRCADMEMRALDCLEAYGLDRGVKKCETLITDFQECALRKKEMGRIVAMHHERRRQYNAGERSKEDRYAPPPKPESF
ncbi:NADH dehydrogenase [ubiquinone] iron-sulfur protein 5 [Tenebrio molitor]|jgi:NADH dehydrogenase (ubiquinone) Fe-S protein 5|uniref:Complex I-15 kDa n=1 Tax=Tenebrio molitor TaxID=7067 RepID=A0A8J6LM64_TENMO|nr:hypothetical protein GEV33_004995 [Tenebrio molitor]